MGSGLHVLKSGAPINRRRLAQILVAASLSSPAWAQQAPMTYPFMLGVASGDPSADGFALWTRLAPQPLTPHGGMALRRLPVKWEVASDEGFRTIVQSGDVIARPEFAHAVHAECAGLAPYRPYWYRFTCEGHMSAVGRAKTMPPPGAPIDRVRFAAAGCQAYEDGFYTAYRYLADEDVDFVFHYGDYVYESGVTEREPTWAPQVRPHIGDQCYTLDEYRLRYAQYKSDPNLKAAHAAAPWFMTFDDHEVSNNWVSAVDRYNSPPEAFALRRAMAWQAWAEHMPIRRAQSAALTGVQLYRRAAYGNLLEAHFLDTRQYRSDQPCGDGFKDWCAGVDAPNARIISADEESWLYKSLAAKKAAWNLIAQQVMVLNLDRRGPDPKSDVRMLNMDSWAGYEAPRERFLKKLQSMALKNVVVLTGDEHQNFVNELRPHSGDPKSPVVAHEFVATSISSGGDGPGERPDHAAILSRNPDCRMINDKRGYALCEVTPALWQTNFRTLDKVSVEGGKLSTLATYVVERGESGVKRA